MRIKGALRRAMENRRSRTVDMAATAGSGRLSYHQEPTFMDRVRAKRAASKAERRAERIRIDRIRRQETLRLERRFVRKQVKRELSRKYGEKRKASDGDIADALLFGPRDRKKKQITLF
jgi:hypothetical protein